MNPNDYILKSITLSTEKFSDFLTMSNEDAGEFIKYLLQYAMDGTRPKMSNAWKQNMYSIYERTITEQMSTLDEKRKKAVQKAREREREKKEALKLLKAEKAKGKGSSTDNTLVEPKSTNTVQRDVTTSEVVQGDVTTSDVKADNGKTTATVADNVSSPEVTPEDLSFTHFVSILGKRDSNSRYNSDAETMWQKFPADVKRKALNWVQDYVSKTPNMNSRQFPYSLLTSHPWDMLGA